MMLTVRVFSQAISNYKPGEASTCYDVVVRAIYYSWVSKNCSA